MSSKSVAHNVSLEQDRSKKKHWQTARDCLKYSSSIFKDSIDSSQNTFLKKRPKMFGDKIILLHFYVSLSRFLLCTKKNFLTKIFLFPFFVTTSFLNVFSLSQQKEVYLKFVVTKVPQ